METVEIRPTIELYQWDWRLISDQTFEGEKLIEKSYGAANLETLDDYILAVEKTKGWLFVAEICLHRQLTEKEFEQLNIMLDVKYGVLKSDRQQWLYRIKAKDIELSVFERNQLF